MRSSGRPCAGAGGVCSAGPDTPGRWTSRRGCRSRPVCLPACPPVPGALGSQHGQHHTPRASAAGSRSETLALLLWRSRKYRPTSMIRLLTFQTLFSCLSTHLRVRCVGKKNQGQCFKLFKVVLKTKGALLINRSVSNNIWKMLLQETSCL